MCQLANNSRNDGDWASTNDVLMVWSWARTSPATAVNCAGESRRRASKAALGGMDGRLITHDGPNPPRGTEKTGHAVPMRHCVARTGTAPDRRIRREIPTAEQFGADVSLGAP